MLRIFRLTFSCIFCILLISCTSTVKVEDLAGEYYNLGNGYYGMGESTADPGAGKKHYQRSAAFYKRALELDPKLLNCKFNLALAEVRLEEYNAAENILNELLATDPKNINLLATLGYIYYTQRKDQDALVVFKQILEISPNNEDALYNYGLILWRTSDREGATEAFSLLNESNPEDSAALLNLGKLYLERELYEQSIEWIEQYLELKPADPEAFAILAECYTAVERYFQALEVYEDLLALDAENPRAWFQKAQILLTTVEDPGKGIPALKQAMELGYNDPDAIKAFYSLGNLLEKEEVTKILEDFKRLPQSEPVTSETEQAESEDNPAEVQPGDESKPDPAETGSTIHR